MRGIVFFYSRLRGKRAVDTTEWQRQELERFLRMMDGDAEASVN